MISLQEIKQHGVSLAELCKKYHVLEMYYFYPEKEGGLAYLGDAHFLVLPQKDQMNTVSLHALIREIGEVIGGTAFVQTEQSMGTLLKEKMVSKSEYETAMGKDILIFSATEQQKTNSDKLLQKKMKQTAKNSSSQAPFFSGFDNLNKAEMKSEQNQEDTQIMEICQEIAKLSVDQIKTLLVEVKKIELTKNLAQNSSLNLSFRKTE